MAVLRQLSDMRAEARQLADLQNATLRFPDSEVNGYINRAIRHIYAEIITVEDQPHFLKSTDVTTVSQQTCYALPLDYLQLVSVAWATTARGPFRAIDPYTESERVAIASSVGAPWPTHYGLTHPGGAGGISQGTVPMTYTLEILPSPPGGGVVRVRYIPVPPVLANDTDTFDGLLGFEDAVTAWAAILMRRKDDLDTADLERDMAKHVSRVQVVARRRDRSRPPRTQVVRARSAARLGRRGPW